MNINPLPLSTGDKSSVLELISIAFGEIRMNYMDTERFMSRVFITIKNSISQGLNERVGDMNPGPYTTSLDAYSE